MTASRNHHWKESATDAFNPPDRRPIWQWASENVQMPSVLTVTGLFNPQLSRHLLPIFDALQDDHTRKITLMKPIRGAGSIIGDVWIPWVVKNDPGPMFVIFETDKQAKTHCEDRIHPTLSRCAASAELFPEDRHKLRTTDIKFANGMPLYVSGPSIGNLQAKGVRYLRIEELWAWPNAATAYSQALGRVGDFEEIGMSKVFIISQGGVKDDPLDMEFELGNRQEWNVPCDSCGKFMQADIAGRRSDNSLWGLRWNDDTHTRERDGRWNVRELVKTVRYECFHCGHAHADEASTKARWNLAGKYVVTNPAALPMNASFHYSAAITRGWPLLAEELANALNSFKGGLVDQLIEFTKTRDARSWDESALRRGKMSPTYEVASEWPDEKARFLTVDRQGDGLNWGLVAAWGAGEARRLWFGRLYGEADIAAKAKEYKVDAFRVLIDSGYETRETYAWCLKNGWRALKGSDRKEFFHKVRVGAVVKMVPRSYSKDQPADPEIGKTYQGRRFAVLIHWSNPTIKDRLQRLLDKGKIREPAHAVQGENELEYAKQMNGQWKKRVLDSSSRRARWVWTDNGNDHARDCWCEQVLGATILKLLPEELQVQEEEHKEVAEPERINSNAT